MAIYSLSIKPISRTSGRSAVAAAAYRAGVELVDERTGVEHDYTRRRGVEHVEVVAAPGIEIDRADLWNQAEAAERRRDARVAREHLLALPHELDAEQRLTLAREYAQELVERYGVVVDLAIHAPDRESDQRNHHAHLLVTTRRLTREGLGDKAHIEWSDTKRRLAGLGSGSDEIALLRQRWEAMANSALEAAQVEARIDRRSLADQGVNRAPQIHVGPMGTEQMRRGTPERSERAQLNLEIQLANEWLYRAQQANRPPGNRQTENTVHQQLAEQQTLLEQRQHERDQIREQGMAVFEQLKSVRLEVDQVHGLFRRRRRREAQSRLEALQQRYEIMRTRFNELHDECQLLQTEIDQTRRTLAMAGRASTTAQEAQKQLSPTRPMSQEKNASRGISGMDARIQELMVQGLDMVDAMDRAGEELYRQRFGADERLAEPSPTPRAAETDADRHPSPDEPSL